MDAFIGTLIRRERLRRNLSQEGLCKGICVVSYLSKIEQGKAEAGEDILLPLLKPAIVTSAILKGVGTYNEYYMANLYLQDKNLYQVVSTSLYTFTGPMGSQYQYICAGVIITMIPILIIFLFCQKQIYSGMAMGAVKE